MPLSIISLVLDFVFLFHSFTLFCFSLHFPTVGRKLKEDNGLKQSMQSIFHTKYRQNMVAHMLMAVVWLPQRQPNISISLAKLKNGSMGDTSCVKCFSLFLFVRIWRKLPLYSHINVLFFLCRLCAFFFVALALVSAAAKRLVAHSFGCVLLFFSFSPFTLCWMHIMIV